MRSSRLPIVTGLFLCSASLFAQTTGGFGGVGGKITDGTGEGLPDTTVVLSNQSLGTERSIDTTDEGVFLAPTVTPAEGYQLKVSRKGFTNWESRAFAVSTGQTVDFRVTLQSTEGGNTAAPEGRIEILTTLSQATKQQLTAPEVADTPTSDLQLLPLAATAPGVTTAASIPGVLVFHGVPYANIFLTDGLSTTNMYFEQNPGITKQLAKTAVQDFDVMSAGFGAQFGGTGGGIINAGTRTGTSTYHGEAYGFFRPDSWMAQNRYAPGFDLGQQQKQAGGDFGGPLHGDNLFFFVNFDYLDRNAQGLNRITNPLIANPTGTAVLASNCLATAAQCAVATRFLQSQMNVLVPLWDRSLRGVAKVDYRRSATNTFNVEGSALNWKAPALAETENVAPNGGLLGEPTLREQTRYARAGWIATGSNQITNEMRVGYFEDRIAQYPGSTGLATGTVGISIAGTTVGAIQPISSILPSERRLEFKDNGYWTLGNHTIQAGFNYSKTRDYISSLDNAGGWYNYPSLTAFAQDFSGTGLRSYTSFVQTLGTPARTLDMHELGAFAQDTWRAGRKLTVSFGLRYDRPSLPQPTDVNTTYYQTSTVTAPWLDLSPRAGFAYQINPKTVFRAGFGFYYQTIPGQLVDALFLGNGVYQSSILANPNQGGAPVFPNAIKTTGAIPSGTLNVAYINTNFKQPYNEELSVAVERQIDSNTTVTLSLLHSRGIRLWTAEDFNQANPTTAQQTTETYTIDNAAGQPVGTYTTPYWIARNNGAFAHVYQIENGGSSWYNAAMLQVRRRMSRGISVAASYTFSHAIDNVGPYMPFGAGLASTFNQDVASDRGNSQFDQRQRAVIEWIWEPRITTSNSVASRYLINGWQLSGLATLGSSRYFTPTVDVLGQQFSGVTMNYTSSLNGTGGWARVPFLQIGSLPTGPQYNVDARITRNIPITERISARLMFEAYNLFNTQFNTGVNTIAYIAVPTITNGLVNGPYAGVLKPVPGVGLGNVAGGYPDGTNARRLQVAVKIVF